MITPTIAKGVGALAPSAAGDTLTGDACIGLELGGTVAILSACRAGDAPLRRGEDALAGSLAGAMLERGARCVIVPLADIRSGPHLEAMAIVHRELARHRSPAAALFAARREVRSPRDQLELLMVQVHGRAF